MEPDVCQESPLAKPWHSLQARMDVCLVRSKVLKPEGQETQPCCFLSPGLYVSTGQTVAVGLLLTSRENECPGALTAGGNQVASERQVHVSVPFIPCIGCWVYTSTTPRGMHAIRHHGLRLQAGRHR